jgi:hypothetical protein
MRTAFRILVLVGLLAPLAQATAHHSAATLYDLSKHVTMQGVVTEFQLGNPHLRIYFDVDNQGKTEKWMAEGGSRTVLLRKGWTGMEVKPGDKVGFRGNPSRDGSNVMHLEYLILPGGTEKYAEDIDRNAGENLRKRSR